MQEKLITVEIDENGNVSADFSGFIGDACLEEEQRLRRELAECGMLVTPRGPGQRNQGAKIGASSVNRQEPMVPIVRPQKMRSAPKVCR